MTAAADRHLLFGLLALQNGLIDQGQLMLAFQAWTRDKTKSLADHLEARGDLTGAKKALLYALAEVHLEAHGGDVEKSLAAVPANRSTRASLAELGEPEIEATLARVARNKNGHATEADDEYDPDRTGSLSVGGSTGDGQRFRLLRPHARGGLGEVFVALDCELHREVALKQILEKHADDPVSRQRFVLEAEVTGGLEHPGIVPVYGLGTYGSGRPYYAMRFIKGDSLKEAIENFHGEPGRVSAGSAGEPGRVSAGTDSHGEPGRVSAGSRSRKTRGVDATPLAFRKLLRRFLDVCNAIDYAHSRGVIHRDIKPANIILGKHGETLVVDWGLAKAVGRADPSVGEETIAPSSSASSETMPGSAMGTPAYMSPEQACGDLDRLGPRSDVYSLGATLYCLLTGKPPFEGEDVGEILRRVQAGDLRAPREVDPSLDKALEAVSLKAMATKPADRYASARALADDVERWMADEPLTAYPEPWARTLVRWLTRHRTGVTGLAAAVLAGVVGLSAVLAVQTRANAQLSGALKRETKARLDLAAANGELVRSRQAVQARYDLAVDAIKTFHTGVSEDFLLKQDQFKELRDRLLKSASDFYGKLGALLGKDTDIASRRALAQSNFELAELTGKVGRNEDALAAHRAVLAAREALAAEPGAGALAKVDVGRSLIAVAGLLQAIGKTDEARASCRRSESLLAGPAGADPSARAALAACRSRMGRLLQATGKAADALAAYRLARGDQEALAAAPGASNDARRDLADTINLIGNLLGGTGKPSEAVAEFRRALALTQKLADDNPAVAGFRTSLADSHWYLGWALPMTGKLAEAEAEHRRALALYQKLADDNPAVTEFRSNLAWGHNNLGWLLRDTGKPAEAEAELRKGLAIRQKLADDNPAVTDFRSDLAGSHQNLGVLLKDMGKPVAAAAEYRKALALRQRLADDHPALTGLRSGLAGSHQDLGWLLRDTGKPAEAEAELRKAMAIRQKLAGDAPADTGFRSDLAWSHRALADLLSNTGKPAEAEAEFRKALAIRQKLADDNPADTSLRSSLADFHFNHGILLSNTGKPAEAEAEFRKALAIYQKMVDDNPSVIDLRGGLSFGYLRVASLQAWFGQDKELSSTCEKLFSLAKDTEDSFLGERAAKCCSLRQADPKRCETALVLARRAVEQGKGSRWLVYFKMALGMAEYRSGHFAEAEAALTATMNDPGKNNTVSSISAFYRAMGLFRQGNADLARKLATEAAAKMKPLPADEQKPLLGGAYHDDLIMWLAYKEAKAMIQFDATRATGAQPHTK
ncbi:MAG: tetratricopeptide repeat protein [Isosphaeraceae bacterium]